MNIKMKKVIKSLFIITFSMIILMSPFVSDAQDKDKRNVPLWVTDIKYHTINNTAYVNDNDGIKEFYFTGKATHLEDAVNQAYEHYEVFLAGRYLYLIDKIKNSKSKLKKIDANNTDKLHVKNSPTLTKPENTNNENEELTVDDSNEKTETDVSDINTEVDAEKKEKKNYDIKNLIKNLQINLNPRVIQKGTRVITSYYNQSVNNTLILVPECYMVNALKQVITPLRKELLRNLIQIIKTSGDDGIKDYLIGIVGLIKNTPNNTVIEYDLKEDIINNSLINIENITGIKLTQIILEKNKFSMPSSELEKLFQNEKEIRDGINERIDLTGIWFSNKKMVYTFRKTNTKNTYILEKFYIRNPELTTKFTVKLQTNSFGSYIIDNKMTLHQISNNYFEVVENGKTYEIIKKISWKEYSQLFR